VKFYRKQQLRDDVVYIKISSDFILDLYEKSKKMSGIDRKIMLDQIKLFSEHMDEYIEKPVKQSINTKKS